MAEPTISVIIPALDAAQSIGRALASVAISDLVTERIVVDGGSGDRTVAVAEAAGARVIMGPKGRGVQLAAGARAASAGWLLFLHADTVLDAGWAEEARAFVAATGDAERAAVFRFALDDHSPDAARLEAVVAWRSRVLALPYGDQGLLIPRRFYDALGGFAPLALYEDVDIVRRIGRRRLVLLRTRAVTSAARYRRSGYWVRSLRNLLCLVLYRLGLPPRLIVRLYG